MNKKRILFVCIHNSARSQMAEAMVNTYWGDRFEALSAGFTPGRLNPLAIQVMQEWDVDISSNKSKSVFDFFKKGLLTDYVITVCDEGAAEQCPIFPGITKRLHWSFPDPAAFEGSFEEKIERTRKLRDSIKSHLENWIAQLDG